MISERDIKFTGVKYCIQKAPQYRREQRYCLTKGKEAIGFGALGNMDPITSTEAKREDSRSKRPNWGGLKKPIAMLWEGGRKTLMQEDKSARKRKKRGYSFQDGITFITLEH